MAKKQMTLKEIEQLMLQKKEQYKIKLIPNHLGHAIENGAYVPTITKSCCFVGTIELGEKIEESKITPFVKITGRSLTFETGLTYGFDGKNPLCNTPRYMSGHRFGKKMREKYLNGRDN